MLTFPTKPFFLMPIAPKRAEKGATQAPPVSADIPGRRPANKGIASHLARQYPCIGNQDQQAPIDVPLPENTKTQRKVRYSHRGMLINTFVNRAKLWMENEDSNNKVAVVFYNILTTDISNQPDLQTLISGAWETNNKAGNICIFVAPSERGNLEGIVNAITNSRLNGLFFDESAGNVCTQFSKERCIHIGSPDYDEIKNLLRRLMIIGTDHNHVKAKINYEDLEKIALRIMANSRKKSSGAQKLRYIRESMLERYIEANRETLITEEVIDEMWGFEHIDRSKALEK